MCFCSVFKQIGGAETEFVVNIETKWSQLKIKLNFYLELKGIAASVVSLLGGEGEFPKSLLSIDEFFENKTNGFAYMFLLLKPNEECKQNFLAQCWFNESF